MIEERSYRLLFPSELEQHMLVVGETDLAICCLLYTSSRTVAAAVYYSG